jgi:lysophospholipase L1-like esterase
MSNNPSQIPVQPIAFEYPLSNFAECLQSLGPVKIVALGSSTTAGEGGIVAYPYRLEALLRAQYPDLMIDVLNRGIGGQEAPTEFARLERDVIAEQPSLVIWQVGTNAVWQSRDQNPPSLGETIEAVREGLLCLLDGEYTDVILMDLQFVPALLTPAKIDAANEMVSALATVARELKVNVFRRFELMRGWHEVEKISFDLIVDPGDLDRLHDSDWATQRLARALKDEIAPVCRVKDCGAVGNYLGKPNNELEAR